MLKRYQGKQNIQADQVPSVCFCKFRGVGVPMDNRDCSVHTQSTYSCDYQCGCNDYRPKYEKKAPGHWPVCVCGHMAQDHN